MERRPFVVLCVILFFVGFSYGVTFTLPARQSECFFEELTEKSHSVVVEFYVVSGGNKDIHFEVL